MNIDDVNLGLWLGLPLGLGSIFMLIRLVIYFQRDFTDQYRIELRERDRRIKTLEDDTATLRSELRSLRAELHARDQVIYDQRRDLIACATERAALRYTVTRHGLPWDPADWGMSDDGR